MLRDDLSERFRSASLQARLTDGRTDWYRIEAKATTAEVHIYDEIGYFGVTAADFVRDLKAQEGKRVTVRINSPGGEVFDGITILNALRRHPGGVDVVVDGLAASAASVIAMAGETITMAKQSQLMIHDGHALAVGPASVMQAMAERLDVVSNELAAVYAERAGGTVEEWRDRMKAGEGRGTTYTAQEAVQAGLADRVEGDGVNASWDLRLFAKIDPEPAPAEPEAQPPAADASVHIQPAAIRAMLKEAFSG